ncbi:MAG: DUF4189 domain-containing protein [Lysobacter sp.]|nr:MAG: DUF4189 domain-containing protein [Lysobacter sp.]
MDFQILGLLRVEIARMNAVRLLGSLALLVAGSAWAEGNCPQGYYPIGGGNGGWAGCAPIPNDNAPAPDPGPQWERRWGAIAVDETVGRFGGAEGYSSARRAEKAALAACRKNGGSKRCKAMGGAYYNQCGALAWGDQRLEIYSAGTAGEANEYALRACSERTTNCKIYYTGCSYPVRVR